jgi:hypothetical protein
MDDFLYAAIEVPGRYPSPFSMETLGMMLGNFHLMFFPFVLAFYYSLYKLQGTKLGFFKFAAIWWLLDWFVILLPGKEHFHYYMQALPVLSLFAFDFMFITESKKSVVRFTQRVGLPLLYAIVPLIIFLQYRLYFAPVDYYRVIAEEIKPYYNEGDRMYSERHAVLYYLVCAPPPFRFVHPTLLTNPVHYKALQIDPKPFFSELVYSRPEIIVRRHHEPKGIFGPHLKYYDEIGRYEDPPTVYHRLKTGAEPK